MRNLQFTIALILLAASSANAQPKPQNPKGNWNAVESLSIGTPISVKTRASFHRMCFFERASDDELLCQPLSRMHPVLRRPYGPRFPLPLPPWPSSYVFERQEIREVRLEHSEATNERLGALTVGGVMATIGAAGGGNNSGLTRGGGALLCGGIGALVGGFFGRDFPLFHRKVIYRQ